MNKEKTPKDSIETNARELSLQNLSPTGEELQDETTYLLSTEANRHQLRNALQLINNKNADSLITFTFEEWDEEYNLHS